MLLVYLLHSIERNYDVVVFCFSQKTDAEASEEEEDKEETPKPSPDADTVILFTKPSNQGLFTALAFALFQHLTNLIYV